MFFLHSAILSETDCAALAATACARVALLLMFIWILDGVNPAEKRRPEAMDTRVVGRCLLLEHAMSDVLRATSRLDDRIEEIMVVSRC